VQEDANGGISLVCLPGVRPEFLTGLSIIEKSTTPLLCLGSAAFKFLTLRTKKSKLLETSTAFWKEKYSQPGHAKL